MSFPAVSFFILSLPFSQSFYSHPYVIARHSDIEPKVEEPFSIYSTLPKSWRETQLVTNVKVEEDEDTLKARQELVNSKSPSELAQITSFSDIPVPSRLSRMVSRNQSVHGSGSKSETRAARDMSSDQMEVASSTKSMRREHFFSCDAKEYFLDVLLKRILYFFFQQSKHQ